MPDLTLKKAADFIDEELKFVGDMLEPEAEQAYSIAVDCLRKAASGEYKPVVHAHWIKTKIFNPKTGNIDNGYKCSKCGLLVGTNKLKYCAKCGAITDEREENNEQAD